MKTRGLILATLLTAVLSLGLQVPAYGTSAPPGTHGPVYTMPDINVLTGVSLNVWGRTANPAAATFDLLFGDPANPGANIIGGVVGNIKDIGASYTYPRGDFTATLKVYDGASVKIGEDTVLIKVRDPILDALSAGDQLNLKINLAIAKGLKWLYLNQNPNGSWFQFPGDGSTALGVLAFENHGHQVTQDHIYTATVQAGLNYLFGRMKVEPLVGQPLGNPEQYVTALGPNVGLRMISDSANSNAWSRATYETGMALEAIVASGVPANVVGVGPATGLTYKNVVEEMVDYFSFSQTDPAAGWPRGGWDYSANAGGAAIFGGSDNSASQWPGLGLLAAERVAAFGVTAQFFVKPELTLWAATSQGATGVGGYRSNVQLCGAGIGTTGSLVVLHNYLGTPHTPGDGGAVDKAFNWIDSNWFAGAGCAGNLGSFYGMYVVFKAMTLYNRATLPTVGDWYKRSTHGYDGNGIATWLVNNQAANGSWTDTWVFGQALSTAAGVLMLAPTVIAGLPQEIEVAVDIKPTSCPNPVNCKSQGILPAAILGTADLDVSKIDPSTIVLEGPAGTTSPIRWALEDVATPFEPFTGKEDCMDCTTKGPDGFMDLTLKFDTQQVVAAIGNQSDKTCVLLKLTGNLKEEFGGTSIVGEDVVRFQCK